MERPDPPPAPETFVSTGRLPPADNVRRLVDEAYERFAPVSQGAVSQVYPALARVPAGLFGICVAETDGSVYSVGDADHPFTIMSVSKPFVFALVCNLIGATGARERLGVNATGAPFNLVSAVESGAGRPQQPDGQPGRDRDHEPRRGRDRRGTLALHPRGPVALRRPRAAAQRGGLCLRLAIELPQPQRRLDAREPGTDLFRPDAGARPLHPPVLARGDRARPRGHGRDPRRRRVQPGQPRPGGRPRGLPRHARGDDHRRPLRDLGRLALRGRPARQERHRRRHRHRLARQGRARDLRASARRGRQQRARPARHPAPLPPPGPRPPRLQPAGPSRSCR